MPVLRNQSVVELIQGVKAFLSFEVGVTRGQIPKGFEESRSREKPTLAEEDQSTLLNRSAASDGLGEINPENIIWIFGSPRTGSTWLSQIMGGIKGRTEWREPFLGVVLGFRDNLANKDYASNERFILGDPHKSIWLQSMRDLFIVVGQSRLPDIRRRDLLVVKEPNGSLSAPLIMEAFPESKLIFLVRDPRDVVASLLDAARVGSWYGHQRYEASAVVAITEASTDAGDSEEEFTVRLARNYVSNIEAVKAAYTAHPEGAKAIVRYEDLRRDTFEVIKKIHQDLQIEIAESQLSRVVEKRAWENLPQDRKGSGKFHRKASPGGWREDLTSKQIEIIEEITAPVLAQFYSS